MTDDENNDHCLGSTAIVGKLLSLKDRRQIIANPIGSLKLDFIPINFYFSSERISTELEEVSRGTKMQ